MSKLSLKTTKKETWKIEMILTRHCQRNCVPNKLVAVPYVSDQKWIPTQSVVYTSSALTFLCPWPMQQQQQQHDQALSWQSGNDTGRESSSGDSAAPAAVDHQYYKASCCALTPLATSCSGCNGLMAPPPGGPFNFNTQMGSWVGAVTEANAGRIRVKYQTGAYCYKSLLLSMTMAYQRATPSYCYSQPPSKY